ncbi:chemotaxis protein CheA [Enterobacter cloacae]|uniref:chemotaxis protein CheA n=1 Tax=Enterobacter cloacae TaxID=550 RepID=UPI001C5B0FFC|nr:chemotaxis protein CheA [Enterobacter cloacae]ELQ9012995.1 chemotaxis protein CheA [Enterobacter cloacae]MBW4195192.1 chemotaxis protein CheA [Enterobacter cloacae subsp. cloacae]MCK6718179.1 chemotaxis protein CheA [Enterobacter cloacae]HBN5340450.1 chemotaxis protein CheA [Enterobacter cloacae]
MDMNDFSQIFFTEAEELLTEMEQLLLQLDIEAPDQEQLNAIFRAAHSLKGGAATFGFTALQETTHLLENLLDQARAGERTLSRSIINLFLECKDIMQAQLEAYQSSQEPDEARYRYICEALREIALEGQQPVTPAEPAPASASTMQETETTLVVTLRNVGAREQTTLRDELTNMGEVTDVEATSDSMTVTLQTTASAEDITAVLCFVLDSQQIEVRSAQATPPVQTPVAVQETVVKKAPPAPRAANQESGSIRVAVSKVDQIINQVGELIITQAMLSQLSKTLDPASYDLLSGCVAQMERNTRELQESVMSIRMMPMDYVFSRFPRLVHDLGTRLNKEVELTLKGGSAELDKSLIERIIDPLTHLVRNSLDHGIEEKEVRAAKGKPVTGNLTLSAEHHGGNIVIEVSDDGAGLNREKILAKARSQGMTISDTMSDDDVWMLIFAAGFSTAESVTDVSGRGVGMDVVRRNILAMGGHVDVLSTPGAGTTIRIILPLTLAILDGMLVKVGDEIYVLPLGAVMESLRPTDDMLCRFVGEERLLQVRGEYLPLVLLRQRLSVAGEAPADDGIVVIVQSAGCRYALWVDQLIGQQQVVVKNLEHNYRKVPGVSAATILGDGSVALILDVVELSTLNAPQPQREGVNA